MQLKVNSRLKPILTNLVTQLRKEPYMIRLILFGSYARMNANESSDIDLLVIVDEKNDRLETHCMIKHILNGIDTSIVVETPNTIKQHGKMQGTVQYYAVREGLVLYQRDDSDQLIGDIDNAGYAEQTEYWLAVAETQLKEAARFNGNYMLSCRMIYDSINSSIKAMLAYEHVNYEFTRDLNKMNKLLLNQFDHDLIRASTWRGSFKPLKSRENKVTDQDVNDGIKMATKIYDKAKNKCAMSETVFL